MRVFLDYDKIDVTLDLYVMTTLPTIGPIDLLDAKMPLQSPLSDKSPCSPAGDESPTFFKNDNTFDDASSSQHALVVGHLSELPDNVSLDLI